MPQSPGTENFFRCNLVTMVIQLSIEDHMQHTVPFEVCQDVTTRIYFNNLVSDREPRRCMHEESAGRPRDDCSG